MALIVEDGTGLANADSLVSVAEADAYFVSRNVTAWAALSIAAKEAALRNAADFLVEQYETRWAGIRTSVDQALSWPRIGVPAPYTQDSAILTSNVIPNTVKRAQYELAIIFATDNPYDPAGSETAGGALISEREKIGPIETEKKYSTSTSASAKVSTAMPAVETDRITAMLAPYLIVTVAIGRLFTERA